MDFLFAFIVVCKVACAVYTDDYKPYESRLECLISLSRGLDQLMLDSKTRKSVLEAKVIKTGCLKPESDNMTPYTMDAYAVQKLAPEYQYPLNNFNAKRIDAHN